MDYKHYNRYIDFIYSRRYRIISNKTLVVKHHIIPRSLNGTDDNGNLIKLMIREHYIAHMILWKTFQGPMTTAFWFMTHIAPYKNMVLSSRQYQVLKLDQRKNQSDRMSGSKHPLYGKHRSEETKRKMKNRPYPKGCESPLYGRKASEETKKKLRGPRISISGSNNYFYGHHHTEETKSKISKSNKGQTWDIIHGKERADQLRKQMSKKNKQQTGEKNSMYGRTGKSHPRYGIPHSEESKKKISEAHIGKVATKETREKMSKALKGKKRSEESILNYKKAANNRPTIECPICNRKITNPNFKKHYNSCRKKSETDWDSLYKKQSVMINNGNIRKWINPKDAKAMIKDGWKIGSIPVAKKPCPYCGRKLDPGNLSKHIKRHEKEMVA